MWRWWILAGVVVMALVVVILGVVAFISGGSGPAWEVSPCTYAAPQEQAHLYGSPSSEYFNRSFALRLDVNFGETALIMMELENISGRARIIETGMAHIPLMVVTTPYCEAVWYAPYGAQFLASIDLHFRSGEVMRFGGEWPFTDNWGEMVPPGDYFAHVIIGADKYPSERSRTRHGAFKRIRVGEAQLRAARPAHPPTPVGPSACGGGLSGEVYTRWVMNKHPEVLDEWDAGTSDVLYASLLDENRRPTEAVGIRVVVHNPYLEGPPKKLVPDCLEGVPVQLVVRLGY